jgi:hypothetical protein
MLKTSTVSFKMKKYGFKQGQVVTPTVFSNSLFSAVDLRKRHGQKQSQLPQFLSNLNKLSPPSVDRNPLTKSSS